MHLISFARRLRPNCPKPGDIESRHLLYIMVAKTGCNIPSVALQRHHKVQFEKHPTAKADTVWLYYWYVVCYFGNVPISTGSPQLTTVHLVTIQSYNGTEKYDLMIAFHTTIYAILYLTKYQTQSNTGEEATKLWSEQRGPEDGFYLSLQIRNSKKTAILVKEVNPKKKLFLIHGPNTGKQLKLETYSEIKKKYKKVSSDDAVTHWVEQYTSSAHTCTHDYWRGNCKKAGLGLVCEVGLRCRTYYVLCGLVLSIWTKVEGVLASVNGTNVKMQIVCLRTEDGQRIVGLIIPANCASPLVNLLSTSDQSQQLAVQQEQIWQQHHPQSIAHFNSA
ncbi:protein strawberry notch homolog 1-like [Erythrolamprus reginae]|uniref:protein strawberry notch homolog 1-like n=1 Tax=Erythrolamprus reginae TaxID=121349 RepID=UPI00396C8A47